MKCNLTDREEQILRLIAEGFSNRDISSHLYICESTVENHIHNIFRKLGVTKRIKAVICAHDLGLLNIDILPRQ